MAARELALWCIYYPDKMHDWASKQKESLKQEGVEILDQAVRESLQGPTFIRMECPKTWSVWRAWRLRQVSFIGIPW